MVIVLTASLLFYSCKGNALDTTFSENAMQMAAKALNSKNFTGSLNSESAGNELVLNYNNGSKLIVIDKLPESEPIPMNPMALVEVIISSYGLVIKDITCNQVLLLVNNDPESLEKFERIKTLFGNTYQSAKVFGTTIINADRS